MILSPLPKLAFLDNNGRPLVGGLLFTYVAGTSTKIDTYTDSSGGSLNSNPISLDYRGEANVWLDPTKTYKLVLAPRGDTDPPTSVIWTVDNISPLGTAQAIGQILYPRTADEVAHGVTPTDYTYPTRLFQRYGILCDGVTDNTSLILSIANAMLGTFTIPYNAYFNRATLLATLDQDALLHDLSQVCDFNSAGETTKRLGIISKDGATSDSQWGIDSGHFPVLALNNFGTATGASATARRVALFWAAGQYALGGVGKQGDRPCSQLVFGKDSGGDYWTMRLESYAPWLAIDGEYERWDSGQTITAGMYRLTSAARVYVSLDGGTTTATEPTVTSGTQVVDGITWQYVDDGQHTIFSIDQWQRVLIGSGSGTNSFQHKTSVNDPGGGAYSFLLQASGVSQNVDLRFQPTDAGSSNVSLPFFRAQDAVGIRVLDSTSTREMLRLTESDGCRIPSDKFSVSESSTAPVITNGTTIATATVGTARVAPAGAVTGIILAAGTVAGQTVAVINESANTVTFAAPGTSNVADGTGAVIAGSRAMAFLWDSQTNLWYRT